MYAFTAQQIADANSNMTGNVEIIEDDDTRCAVLQHGRKVGAVTMDEDSGELTAWADGGRKSWRGRVKDALIAAR